MGEADRDELRQSFQRRFPYPVLVLLAVTFAVLSVVGQVGQNVTLPLWSSSAQANCDSQNNTPNASNSSGRYVPVMDPYFVLSFASLSFVVIFGIITLVIAIIQPRTIKENLRFPQWQLFLIGLFDALNGVLVVYASPSIRTAPFLQAVLGNFLIPMTIVFRLILLRKKPTLLKLICALMVFTSLLLSLIPVITGMDKDSDKGKQAWLQQSTASRILWPLCFMLGFVPAALMNVIEEKSLKDTRNVNLFYLLFSTSSYQLLTVGFFFWTDIIPKFGYADGIHEFGEKLALVTPLGYLFWSLFDTDECGRFFWRPHTDSLTYFSAGGIVLMFPAVLLYNIGTIAELKKVVLRIVSCCPCVHSSYKAQEHIQDEDGSEIEPLLKPHYSVKRY